MLRSKRFQLLCLICLVLGLPKSAFALGQLGHQLVCNLALNQLAANQQQQINELLAFIPQDEQVAINKYLGVPQYSAISFTKACTWADAIKKWPQYKKYSSWHYMNVPRSTQVISLESCQKNCIMTAINLHSKQLTNSENKQKAVKALMFLGHWLGDIHQPLHVSFKSDWGGTKNRIKGESPKCQNLHLVWDICLLEAAYSRENRFNKFTLLNSKLTQQLSDKYSLQTLNTWRKSSVVDWANESFQLTISPQLHYCFMNRHGECAEIKGKNAQLPLGYYVKFGDVIEQRVLQAAVRLAKVLEDSLPR